jgi:hypothetical protein
MQLDTELKYYESHKADLLKAYRGQVMLIRGETLVGVFPTEEEAYQAAVKQFGKTPWLIAKVEEGSTPHPAGQQLLRQTGFLAQVGMTDEVLIVSLRLSTKSDPTNIPEKWISAKCFCLTQTR